MTIRDGNIFIPTSNPTFAPWMKAWSEACTGLNCSGLAPGFWNSVKITIPSVIVSIAVASVSGYSLANWPFKFAEFFFTVLLVGSFIPYQVMLYPLVIITREMGIYSHALGGDFCPYGFWPAHSHAALPELFCVAAA